MLHSQSYKHAKLWTADLHVPLINNSVLQSSAKCSVKWPLAENGKGGEKWALCAGTDAPLGSWTWASATLVM